MIDIIVPTHNHLDLTKECLECLYSNTREPFNLVIVDDSTDETVDYIECLDYENITLIHSDFPFKCGNQIFNIGLKECKSDYVALIMNSVKVEPEWEIQGLQFMAIFPQVGLIGFKCLFPNGLIESAGLRLVDSEWVDREDYKISEVSFTDIGRGEPGHRHSLMCERDAVQWAFCLLRREAVPSLQEDIYYGFLGWDDVDNCYVMKKNGWRIFYCGTGVGYHQSKATREDASEEADKKNKENAYRFFERWSLLKDG